MEALLTKFVLALSIALQIVILLLLIRRRVLRRLPWFSIYIGYVLIEAALRFSVASNKGLYYNVYWLTAIGGVTFAVLAVRESFLNVFRSYIRLDWFMWIVWGCIALALLYAIFKAWVFPPTPATGRGAIIVGVELAVDYTVVAIGLLYFALTAFFKIKGHNRESGVIAGFTISSAFTIIPLVAMSVFGTRFRTFREWLPAIAYIIAEIGWTVAFARPEPEPPVPQRDLTLDDLTKLNQYIGVLARLLGRKS